MNRQSEWRLRAGQWAPWVLAVGLALVAVLGTARWLVNEQLADDGAEAAQNWVALVHAGVPGLADAARGGRVGAADVERLRLFGRAYGVFRYRLQGPDGRWWLDSAPGSPTGEAAADAGAPAGAGGVRVQIHHHGSAEVEHFSVVRLPLGAMADDAGTLELHVDQTAQAERLESAFLLLCGLVVLLTLALAGAAAWRGWRHLRRQLRTEERVRYMASHDLLSDTLNRNGFLEALEAAAWRRQGGGPGFAVLCIDLDRFKEVNDGHGHAAGDEVLRAVGERLRSVLRHGDAVARLGGDEFAVMQMGIQQPQDVARLAQRIVELLAEPFPVGEARMQLGGSVGAALFDTATADVDTLMKHADTALYQAKRQGRGCFRFYDADVDQAMQGRRELARDLRDALEAGQLHLAFQALYGADGRTLQGYEALMRWTHPVRGAVPPAEFIPLAEEGGLIVELGAWALQEACRHAAGWPQPLCVSVNLSPAQFERGDLVATVRDALQRSGLDATRLELEITESLLINNTQQVLASLTRLSETGVRVAMDDFGTGYSSLAYLWRFPFDRIKIDRAFVADLVDDPKVDLIVKSIIELAHALRIRVTGEGVETAEQLSALARHGCDEVQGFLLARPSAAEHLPHRATPPP